MTGSSYMARFGARLVANSYRILPIAPGTKKPGQFRKGGWRDYPGWNRHATRATSDAEVSAWSAWPDAGIGVVGGAVAAIDIDILDPAVGQAIEALARARLGDTPALRIGRAPKRLLVYRTAVPFKGVKRSPIEVLCLGQQFVAFADHPETGQPYAWPEESLADLDLESLPVIDEAQARAFLDGAIALVPPELRPATLAAANGHSTPVAACARSQKGTPEAVEAALALIPNTDIDYDSWIKIGLAIKGAIGDAGAALFKAWSAQSAKNDPAFTAKTWAGLKPERIGAGSIYHLATERGWKPDPSLVLNGAVAEEKAHPAAGLLAKLSQSRAFSPPAPSTPALDRLDGVLKQLVDYIVVAAIRPQPWLAVGAALAALGALMGRKVRTDTDLRSNLYVIGIAESGGGKDHARKAIKEAFVRAGLAMHLGGEHIASGSGLLAALTREPSSLFQLDEFGKFVANVVDKRRAPKHLSEIWDLLTELWTSAATNLLGAEYADQKERPRQDIAQPCACVHGVTAPQPFWEAFRSLSLHDGSLARFLVFRAAEDIPDRNPRPAELSQVPPDLIAGLRRIAAGVVPPRGNLQAISAPMIQPDPFRTPMDDDAQAIFKALDEETTARQRKAVGTSRSAILARVWENTAKVALIKAVSANPESPIIRGEDAEWAREVVASCVASLLGDAERHLADNETERNHKRVLEFIRNAGGQGITRNELTRRTQFLDNRQRGEILISLTESEQIAVALQQTGKRQATVYRTRDPSP